jgi:hypothetical protein
MAPKDRESITQRISQRLAARRHIKPDYVGLGSKCDYQRSRSMSGSADLDMRCICEPTATDTAPWLYRLDVQGFVRPHMLIGTITT